MDNERPTPLLEDPEGTRKKLESWLSQHRGHSVTIPALNIPEATGMSNVTLLFDVEWQEHGATHSEPCVGRLQPEIERPVFPSYDLSLQYEVMASIGKHSTSRCRNCAAWKQTNPCWACSFILCSALTA